MSNKLIDVLDDDEKMNSMNENYHYKQSVMPRLEKLIELIRDKQFNSQAQIKDLDFVDDLIEDLKENPHHRITAVEMKHCNELWKKYS